MKLSAVALSLVLLSNSAAWALPNKKKVVKPVKKDPEEYACFDDGNSKDFFDDLAKISKNVDKNDLKMPCSDDDDPRIKALKYIRNMRMIAKAMPHRATLSAVFLVAGDQKKENEKFDERIKKLEKTKDDTGLVLLDAAMKITTMVAPELKAVKSFFDVMGLTIKLIKTGVAKGVKIEGADNAADEKARLQYEGNTADVKTNGLKQHATDMVDNFINFEARLGRIDDAITNSNPKALADSVDAELMRSLICQFSRETGKSEHFCTQGGTDYGKGNSLACEDVEAFAEKNRKKELARLDASFSRGIANTVEFDDKLGINKNGTTARFELVLSSSKNDTLEFNGPGGTELLCKIANDPKFDSNWNADGTLNPYHKVGNMGLPIAILRKEKSTHSPNGVNLQVSGDLSEITLAGKTSAANTENMYDFKRLKSEWDVPLSEIKGMENCRKTKR